MLKKVFAMLVAISVLLLPSCVNKKQEYDSSLTGNPEESLITENSETNSQNNASEQELLENGQLFAVEYSLADDSKEDELKTGDVAQIIVRYPDYKKLVSAVESGIIDVDGLTQAEFEEKFIELCEENPDEYMLEMEISAEVEQLDGEWKPESDELVREIINEQAEELVLSAIAEMEPITVNFEDIERILNEVE